MQYRFFQIVLFVVLSGLISCSGNKPDNSLNDREQWNLKGNVKSLSEINYSTGGKFVTNISFNKNGFVTNQVGYNPDGSLIRKWIYQYDNQNRKLIRDCYVLKDSLSYTMHYYYNDQGKLSAIKSFSPNGLWELQTIYQYDENLNLTKEATSGEKNSAGSQVLTMYNEKKQLIEETHIDSLMHSYWKQIYTYNSKGLKVEISYKTLSDSLIKDMKYTYLENGKVDKVNLYNEAMKFISTTAYKYDDRGNTKEILNLLPDNTIQHIQVCDYKYDKYGNWIYLSETNNNKLGNIMTRKIEYY